MAKKKSNNKKNQHPGMSPKRFMQEKVRTLPIDKCYIAPPDWKENGIAHVLITRKRPSGNLAMASFLVDTFCLGVKDAWFLENITTDKFQSLLDKFNFELGVEEISYGEAHNIIYGAIAFAEEGGIEPVKDFDLAGYILEEDTDDVPLIEYEFGKNGKHFLVINEDRKEMPYYHILKKNLGDNFEFLMPYDVFDDMEEYPLADEDDEDNDEFQGLAL